jgi:hypothetical protein
MFARRRKGAKKNNDEVAFLCVFARECFLFRLVRFGFLK